MGLSQQATESKIVTYFRNGLIFKLGLDPTQCSIASVKTFDALWRGRPYYQVIPGKSRPDGQGRGAQDGGSLIRVMPVAVVFFNTLNLDQYSASAETLVRLNDGSLQEFEEIRQVFAYTFFGSADGSDCLLMEPVMIDSEGETTWTDVDKGVYERTFNFTTMYGLTLPGAITLTLPQVMNPVGPND